jgi:CelD/BcsL family acetyltransferase involved in cellulose biosynthesis
MPVIQEIAQVVDAAPVGQGMTVRVVDPVADPRWDAFAASDARASVYHLSAWCGILDDAYRYSPTYLALEDHDGRLRGILPLAYKTGRISGRRLISLPMVTQGGPLAETAELEAALIAAACRLSDESGAVLRVHSRGPYHGLLPAIDRQAASPAWVAPVPDDVSEPPGRGKRKANLSRYIRKAQAAGLTARETTSEEDLRAFYAVYLRTARKHRAVPHSLRLFEVLRRALTPAGVFQMVLIERGTQTVAGAVNLVWRDVVEALFFGVDDRCLDLHPSHLLHWEVLRRARATGLRFVNFGTARYEGSQGAFKAQWGAEPIDSCDLVYPAAPSPGSGAHVMADVWERRLAARVWEQTPLALMGLAGGLTYRYL